MSSEIAYILRPAVADDLIWLEPFYEKLMRPYVELTHTWSSTKFRECFAPADTSIIQAEVKDIGMVKVQSKEGYIFLGDIQIEASYQNKGIGSEIIKEVIGRSISSNIPIRLRVLKGNPAVNLYLRLGFKMSEELTNSYELIFTV